MDICLSKGDKNTNFFHSSTKLRRQCNRISCIINSNGRSLSDEDAIVSEAVGFFKCLLSVEPISLDNTFVNSIPPFVSQEDNRMLMAPFSLDVLRGVVFSMHLKKALRLNGFTALFF